MAEVKIVIRTQQLQVEAVPTAETIHFILKKVVYQGPLNTYTPFTFSVPSDIQRKETGLSEQTEGLPKVSWKALVVGNYFTFTY